MSEVAAQPSPEPPTLRDIVAAHTDALTGARLEMAALRRALDAAKLSPGRVMTDGMLYRAVGLIADYEQETIRLAGLIGQSARLSTWCEMFEAEQAAELAVVPEAAPRAYRKPRQARQPGTRSLRSLGITGSAGAGLRAAFSHKLLTAGAITAAGVAVVNMQPSHTLEDIIHTWHLPAASAPAAAPYSAIRITYASPSAPTAFVRAELPPVKVREPVTLAAAPVEVPAVAVPQVTPDPSSDSSQTYQSSTSSQTPQPSLQLSSLQLPSFQSHGRHAAPDSPPGVSGYQGRHAGISLDGTGQHGSGQGGRWQGGQQQNGGWRNGNQQIGGGLGGVLQGGNWQGQQQGGHGQFGGASDRPSLLPGNFANARP